MRTKLKEIYLEKSFLVTFFVSATKVDFLVSVDFKLVEAVVMSSSQLNGDPIYPINYLKNLRDWKEAPESEQKSQNKLFCSSGF